MIKHTPGPWSARLVLKPRTEPRLLVEQSETRCIAHVFNAGDIPEAEANAHLIAAAPELLKYLEAIVSQECWDEIDIHPDAGLIGQARKAVRMAKGGAK